VTTTGEPGLRWRALGVAHEPQLRPVLFRLQDRRLSLAGQVLEAVGVEQGLVELAAL
jgi:hypothetical protein